MANETHLALLQQGVVAWNQWREANVDVRPDLLGAHLARAHLTRAYLTGANLAGANLLGANLSRAHLFGTHLAGANLFRAYLTGANLTGARIGWTTFANVDLSMVQGLDTIEHRGPSTIGIDSLYRSHGNIPEVFLRGAGVPDEMITYSKSLVGQPFQSILRTFFSEGGSHMRPRTG